MQSKQTTFMQLATCLQGQCHGMHLFLQGARINDMSRLLRTYLVFIILFTAGCQSAGPAVLKDQLPPHIPKNQTHSVIPLMLFMQKDGKAEYKIASGVILDKHHLLTARHVVHTEEDTVWHECDLADEVSITIFRKCEDGKDHLHINKQEYEIVGGDNITKEVEGCTFCRYTLSDWAVVKIDTPTWNPDDAVSIHKPALDPEWTVPPGTMLYAAGYSPAFSEHSQFELVSEPADSGELNTVVDNDESFATRPVKLHTFYKSGPYIVAGGALETPLEEGHVQRHSFSTPNNYPSIKGHSGGGVFIWNDKTNQLDLIGVICATADVRANYKTHWEGSFLGIPYEFETHGNEQIRSNKYVPIGHIFDVWDYENN